MSLPVSRRRRPPAAFAAAEEFLVGQARTMRWADFTRAMAYWRREARPEDPDKKARSDWDHRGFGLHDGLRGTGLVEGELTPVAKATLAGALGPIEDELFAADWAAAKAVHGDATTTAHLARTPRQRRHDALVELAIRGATAQPGGKRPAPLVSIVLGYAAFKNICELADGTLLAPSEAAAVLADDALLERIIFDGPSRVIDVGEARSFTGATRRALELRDRHCQGAGCHVPGHRCQGDHRWRHSDGGPTIAANGELRCGPHNRQREKPLPQPIPPSQPPTELSLEERAAHLETLRAKTRDHIRHNPRYGYVPIDDACSATPAARHHRYVPAGKYEQSDLRPGDRDDVRDAGRWFVVVSGPPGSGKSTISRPLAQELRLPLIAKDTIKDALMAVMAVPDVNASRMIGRGAVAAMFAVATQAPGGAVLDCNLHRSFAVADLRRLPGQVLELFCRCDRAVALSRYRLRAGSRAVGHFDTERSADELWHDDVSEPVDAGWPVVEVDTNHPVDLAAVVSLIRRHTGAH